MIGKGRCHKGFIWNPSNRECECDKSCDIGQYLDYENCKCRKKLVDKLAEECGEDINENEMIYNGTLNDYGKACKNLNVNKAHGWDQVSIRIIKACGNSIPFPLKLIFKSMINEGVFPEDWKKNNVVPIHIKESKNLIKNYKSPPNI